MNTETTSADNWSLAELVAAAAGVLGDDAVPARTVRFWRSEGVVSAPSGSGRAAKWGWRHLLEVVAARRRQLAGESVTSIASSRRHLSELTADAGLPPVQPDWFALPAPEAFWDPVSPPLAPAPSHRVSTRPATRSPLPASPHRLTPRVCQVIELGAGVTVSVPVGVDVASITSALDGLVSAVASASVPVPNPSPSSLGGS